METDYRLVPSWVIANVEKVFNARGGEKGYRVKQDGVDVEVGGHEVPAYIVYSPQNKECVGFYCYREEWGDYVLKTQGIFKCSNELSSGKYNIMSLLEFCKTHKYDAMVISEDRSMLDFTFNDGRTESISLMKLKLLSNGLTWYNSLGFYAEGNIEQIMGMKVFISQKIENIIKCWGENPNAVNAVNAVKQILAIIGLNENNTLSDLFVSLGRILHNICPQNMCRAEYYDLVVAVNWLLDNVYAQSGIEYNIHDMRYFIPKDDVEEYLGGTKSRRPMRKYCKKTNKRLKTLRRK